MDPVLVPRHAVLPEGWDAFVEAHDRGWVWHLSAWLDYLVASGRKDESLVALDSGGAIVGIMPALLPQSEGDPLPEPLGCFGPGTVYAYRGQPTKTLTASGFITRVIDLSRGPTQLWTDLRKSSHALIHRADEEMTFDCDGRLDPLRACYARRPDLPQLADGQWECLQRLVDLGVLRVYVARGDESGRLLGATGIYLWRDWAYYGHGRSVAKGVAHALQWHVIKTLAAEGWPYYEVGWLAHKGDDDKARSIAHFKAGFGGEDWWVPVTGGHER